jgi:hypothetical protein
MYVKVTNGNAEIYSLGKLRKDNPNTSFSRKVPDEILAAYDVYPYTVADSPDFDERTQKLNVGSITQVDGAWVEGWSVIDKTADEITAYDDAIAAGVRSKRDSLLAETDWTGLSDVTMSAEMATYRQALRDITTHANFPNLEDADWPTKP